MRASAFPNSGLHVGMCVVRARVRFPSPTAPPNGGTRGREVLRTRSASTRSRHRPSPASNRQRDSDSMHTPHNRLFPPVDAERHTHHHTLSCFREDRKCASPDPRPRSGASMGQRPPSARPTHHPVGSAFCATPSIRIVGCSSCRAQHKPLCELPRGVRPSVPSATVSSTWTQIPPRVAVRNHSPPFLTPVLLA